MLPLNTQTGGHGPGSPIFDDIFAGVQIDGTAPSWQMDLVLLRWQAAERPPIAPPEWMV